jgi:hypothetical protein
MATIIQTCQGDIEVKYSSDRQFIDITKLDYTLRLDRNDARSLAFVLIGLTDESDESAVTSDKQE